VVRTVDTHRRRIVIFLITFNIDVAGTSITFNFRRGFAAEIQNGQGSAHCHRCAIITVVGVVFSITILALTWPLSSSVLDDAKFRFVTLAIKSPWESSLPLCLLGAGARSITVYPHGICAPREHRRRRILLLVDLAVLIYFSSHRLIHPTSAVIAGIARDLDRQSTPSFRQ